MAQALDVVQEDNGELEFDEEDMLEADEETVQQIQQIQEDYKDLKMMKNDDNIISQSINNFKQFFKESTSSGGFFGLFSDSDKSDKKTETKALKTSASTNVTTTTANTNCQTNANTTSDRKNSSEFSSNSTVGLTKNDKLSSQVHVQVNSRRETNFSKHSSFIDPIKSDKESSGKDIKEMVREIKRKNSIRESID